MILKNRGRKCVFIVLIFFVFSICLVNPVTAQARTYRAVESWQDVFIVVGDSGHVYAVKADGSMDELILEEETDLCQVQIAENRIYLGGTNGDVYFSEDGENFKRIHTSLDTEIQGIAAVEDDVLIASEDSIVLYREEEDTAEILYEKESVIGIAASDHAVIAATSDGNFLIRQEDGSFLCRSYEATYGERISLTDIFACNGMICAIGEDDNGSPLMISSLGGEVWTRRGLYMMGEGGQYEELIGCPLSAACAFGEDTIVLVCDNGMLALLPACIKCNTFYKISDQALIDVACSENAVCVIEEDDVLQIIQSEVLVQNTNPDEDCTGGC